MKKCEYSLSSKHLNTQNCIPHVQVLTTSHTFPAPSEQSRERGRELRQAGRPRAAALLNLFKLFPFARAFSTSGISFAATFYVNGTPQRHHYGVCRGRSFVDGALLSDGLNMSLFYGTTKIKALFKQTEMYHRLTNAQ